MEINRYDISDLLGSLPDLEPLNIDDHLDLLICTLGFEDRTHNIIDKLTIQQKRFGNILLITYPTNQEDNIKNLKYFENASKEINSQLIRLTYSRKDFSRNLSTIFSKLDLNEKSRVLFDISTCSSYVFYPLMKELFNLNINLVVGYSEAETYYPTCDEWNDINKKAESENVLFVESFENANFQSSGVDDIYSYNLFSEINPGNKPCTLVAVPNFSCKRMNAIIARDNELNKTKYDDIIWLIGKTPLQKNEWRIEAVMKTNNLFSRPPSKVEYVSTLIYKEMVMALEDVWSDLRYRYHLTVGTLGSKNQHLGTFLFLALHHDVGLLLTEPKEFRASRFSEGAGDCWQIRFGATSDLRNLLERYLTFRWKLN